VKNHVKSKTLAPLTVAASTESRQRYLPQRGD